MLNPEVFNLYTQRFCFLLLFVSLLLQSCSDKKKYEGDAILNYPDMELILRENLLPYQQEPYTFKLIHIENGHKDSSFLKAAEVEWDDFRAPFLKANLFRKELDKHYLIDVLHDTLYGKTTMMYTSLDPKAVTSRMSITARSSDNKILSLYAESREAGFFTTRDYKLLFVNGKSLQVQEIAKRPFSKTRHTISTLKFLNES